MNLKKKKKRSELEKSLENCLIKLWSVHTLMPQWQNVHPIFISIVKNIIMYQYFPSFFICCSYFYSLRMQKICLILLPHAIPSCFSQNYRFETGRSERSFSYPILKALPYIPLKRPFFQAKNLKCFNYFARISFKIWPSYWLLSSEYTVYQCLLKMWQTELRKLS